MWKHTEEHRLTLRAMGSLWSMYKTSGPSRALGTLQHGEPQACKSHKSLVSWLPCFVVDLPCCCALAHRGSGFCGSGQDEVTGTKLITKIDKSYTSWPCTLIMWLVSTYIQVWCSFIHSCLVPTFSSTGDHAEDLGMRLIVATTCPQGLLTALVVVL